MATEKERMLAGEPYDPLDPELIAGRRRARALCHAFNALPPGHGAEAKRLLAELFRSDAAPIVTPPFHCDYGDHIRFGRGVYVNCGCVVLDVAPVTIGDHVLFGPAVQLYTATHPMSAAERRSGTESGRPITVGDDVWVGGGAIVCPGVTIGARTVIGAGSVVTRDIPADVFAAGNPCRVIRPLAPDEPGAGPPR